MPKEDVIEIPAVGKELCVHNLFQSNMALQRDKPEAIWGWAKRRGKISVSFAGETQGAEANKDRLWKVWPRWYPGREHGDISIVLRT